MTRVVPLDPRVNPGFLKLDLFCRGARLHASCLVEDDGGRPILRARAGLGSGLELVLPAGLHVNVPVTEDFTRESPYEIRRIEGLGGASRYAVFHRERLMTHVRLASRPAWYERRTQSGKTMRRVATLQGTYLAVYPAQVCHFWVTGEKRPARENCRFCSVGLNLGADEEATKSVDEVMEVVHAARRESQITYVDFNTGHYDGSEFLPVLEPYVRRVKEETGLLVGIQTPPFRDPADYARVKELGVNRISFCFEVFDRDVFPVLCPGKHRVYGLDGYLGAIEACTALEGGGFRLQPWVVNGEIIAGLESPESSMAAIDWLTSRGAVPTVCVFRPLQGTQLEAEQPPRTEDLIPVFQSLYVRCMEARLPIGVAPNIHVSLVLLPDEARWLVQDEALLARLEPQVRRLRLQGLAFRAAFYGRRGLRRGLGPRAGSRAPRTARSTRGQAQRR